MGGDRLEEKRRTALAVAIIVVVLLAVLSSFLPTFLSGNHHMELADPSAADSSNPTVTGSGDDSAITVRIEPDTVQTVIASLNRYASYSRTVSAEYYDDNGGFLGTLTAQVWSDDGWTRTTVSNADGSIEHSIVGDNTLWLWYEGETTYYSGPADAVAEDRMQRLPTYEDVLALDKDAITDAGYTEWEGQDCIYVEAEFPLMGYTERYWISEASGLLMSAETVSDGVRVYAMSSYDVVSPLVQAPGAFTLPDGTVLYDPSL